MRRFGLIGEHLPHSFSARYFAEKFEQEGIEGCEYSLYELPNIEALEGLLNSTEGLEGFNITIPYKLDVMRYLDELSPEAEAIGAVNCVRIFEDRMVGHNTDVIGLRDSMVEFLGDYRPERALILGTGGASLAVIYVLRGLGIEYQVVSRRAKEGWITYDDITPELLRMTELIVNTTPLGTFPNVDSAPDLDYNMLTPSHHLFDLVYNPPLTKFLAEGQARGAKICNGEVMLIGQAEASWQIWNQ